MADGRQLQSDQRQSFPRYIFYFIGDGMGLAQVALSEALAFYRSHPDGTLIIVTADHECGGLALGNDQVRYSGRLSFPMAMDSFRVYFAPGQHRSGKGLPGMHDEQ
ncbi:hypothetical protein CR161_00260 [Prosthecochloris sp. ZM]|uniref:hypothetical protein n=1 Tax=Prosthecochloris sp. ZM TaxID=2283143 RepID=UPI000DF84022|nr:hypothetical protein [Prosthecochloris sp. ZM]RDD29260.1 hypothetical protein CR161_00260 [Prosthecochloris sp. ZM]